MAAQRTNFTLLILLVATDVPLAAAPSDARAQRRFGTRLTFPTGNRPQGFALGDLNRDGVLDLVTANYLPTPSRCCSATPTGPGRTPAPVR